MPTPGRAEQQERADGPRGSFKSARERRSALQMAETASRWPTTTFSISLSTVEQPLHFVLPHPLERNARPFGNDVQNVLFVHHDALFLARRRAIRFSSVSSFSFACFSLSRIWAAPSKSWFLIAFSFLPLISSISASIALTSGGRVIVLMRAREPASSNTSIALSGKNRSVM